MNIDSSVLYAVVSEIKNELPARIQKYYQHNYELHIFITGQIIIKIGY